MSWLNEEALDIFVDYYYPKAKWLQNNVNWGPLDYEGPEAAKAIDDPLMQKIDIYDCFTRNAAGFSNVLQDLRFGSKTPKWRWQDKDRRELNTKNDLIKWDTKTWMYVFLSHRVTGSGASFESDHGYRNNIIQFGTSTAFAMIQRMLFFLPAIKHRIPEEENSRTKGK